MVLSVAFVLFGCEEYNPPPEAKMVPSTGSYQPGELVKLSFSEPIDSSTLILNIWPNNRDEEGAFLPDVQPLISGCVPGSCGENNTLTIDDDGLGATLTLDPEGLGKPNVPLVLEITSDLKDTGGNQRGVSRWFDFKFSYTDCPEQAEDVQFQEGIYLLVGSTTEPLPAALRLVSHFKMLPDGRFSLAGAEANLKDDVTNDTTTNPDDLVVDDTEQGWTIFATGRICVIDGSRRINSDPFIVELTVAGIDLRMDGVRLEGEVSTTAEGHDQIDALLVYEKLTLTTLRPTEYDGNNAPITGVFVPEEKFLEGSPDVCGAVCGAAEGIGKCEPPEGFPDAIFCPDEMMP